MLALAVELLGGRYVATSYNDRTRAEWPPHPARLFSALVATWADGDEPQRGYEAAALRWLERQPAPEILASSERDVGRRTVAPVYVPVNDVHVVSPPDRAKLDDALAELAAASEEKARVRAEKNVRALEKKLADATAKAIAAPSKVLKENPADALLPERRTRQPRTFPSITPSDPRVLFVWPELEVPDEHGHALDGLASRLVRLGHSSTLVMARRASARSVDSARAVLSTFRPSDGSGSIVLRWVSAGQLDRLDAAFALHRETEPRVLPAQFVRYEEGVGAPPTATPTSDWSDDLVVLRRMGGPRLPMTAAASVARQLRRALMAAALDPVPEILSGHGAHGGPSERAHLAVVPLPFVGAEHADGAILGIALVLPRACSADERRAVLEAIARLENAGSGEQEAELRLLLGDAGVLELERIVWGEDRRTTLRASTWSRASRSWSSATPVALDRNPGDLHDPDPEKRARAFEAATDVVRTSVERIGLPAPERIDVVRSSVIAGSAKPRTFPPFPIDRAKEQRVLVHVRLVFAEPVRGPVLIGAGRYHGLGLCMPVEDAR